jgi:hypothetical protein
LDSFKGFNLQETTPINGENHGFLQRFSKENQSNELFDDWQGFFEKNGAISG